MRNKSQFFKLLITLFSHCTYAFEAANGVDAPPGLLDTFDSGMDSSTRSVYIAEQLENMNSVRTPSWKVKLAFHFM